MTAAPPSLARQMAAAFDWWRDAGVDYGFCDDATVWLYPDAADMETTGAADHAEPALTKRDFSYDGDLARGADPAPAIDLLGESPPTSLEEFHRFWLESLGLDTIGPRGRIAPRGAERAEVMILTVHPEETDRENLLSGPQGALLANFLVAAGIDAGQAYFASALPRHMAMADTAAIARSGITGVTLHHIELAQPKRIIAFGANILPLIGHDQAQDITAIRHIDHGGKITPLLVSEDLDSLMSMPRLKARFWKRWMGWSLSQ